MTGTTIKLGVLAAALSMAACGGGGGGGNGAPDASGGGGGCTLVGTWMTTGTAAGATYQANANGTALLSFPNNAGTLGEMWSAAGDTVSFSDTVASGAGSNQKCDASVVGQYRMAFANSCNSVSFTLVADACAMRAQVVNGMTMTR